MSKIFKNKAYHFVVERIVKGIQEEGFSEGDKLPTERELSEEYGVSRSTIREALSVLESAGLIEIKPRSGIRVISTPSEKMYSSLMGGISGYMDPMELIEIRMGIECNAAYFAAQRKLYKDLLSIEGAFNDLKTKNEKLDYDVDFQFHRAIVASAHNISLLNLYDQFMNDYKNQLDKNYGFANMMYSNNSPSLGEHQMILQAIKEGDGIKSEQAMRRHLLNAKDRLTFNLENY